MLIGCLTDALCDATMQLAFDDHGIDHRSAVLDHQIAEDVDGPGPYINLDHGRGERVGKRPRILAVVIAARRFGLQIGNPR